LLFQSTSELGRWEARDSAYIESAPVMSTSQALGRSFWDMMLMQVQALHP